jgi:tetratricopeptide (TPR) repeat protein
MTKLGASGADLSALTHFFEQPFAKPSRNLHEFDQALVLANAAFRLRALGRLTEAVEPMAEGLERIVASKRRRNAAIGAGNLSAVRLTIGDVGGAVATSAEAVRHADAMADDDPNAAFRRLLARTTHADALHRAGDLYAAAALFADAERRQVAWRPDVPLLYYEYYALLLSRGEASEMRRRAAYAIDIDKSGILVTRGLDVLSLGRAALALGDTAEAAAQLDAAVTALEDAGSIDHTARCLLARAALHRALSNWGLAASDLTATDEIADRSGMKLFETDSAIERARLTLARDGAAGVTAAAALVARAKDLIDETRSHDHEGKERFYAVGRRIDPEAHAAC